MGLKAKKIYTSGLKNKNLVEKKVNLMPQEKVGISNRSVSGDDKVFEG